GSIRSVSFYADAALVGTATNPPYALAWTKALVGHYAITAVATDDRRARAVSLAATITVAPPANYQPPTVRVLSPSDGAVFPTPSTVTLTAGVQFTSAPPVSVQFVV